ncbi:tRNA methyltransferase 2 [Chamberlinius hualienensis]
MPLGAMKYEDQLAQKSLEMRKQLVGIGRSLWKCGARGGPKWLLSNQTSFDQQCCEFQGLTPSPVVDEYRNKCEFTVGVQPNGNGKPVVGFRLAKYSQGSLWVAQPTPCTIVPQPVIKIAQLFEDFLEGCNLPPYDPIDHSGCWKQLTVRYTSLNQLMVIVVIHPQSLDTEELTSLEDKLTTHFLNNHSSTVVTSLYVEHQMKRSDCQLKHIGGSKYIVERLMGLSFRISPLSFFQVNTAAAELLYQAIEGLANLRPTSTVLLDICCGTGTIAISLAKKVLKVIGIEMIPSAIEDALFNAKENGVENVEFICGKVEDTLTSILYKYSNEEVVAIVDPPRAGLHNKVIRSIRSCKGLRRLIYVACDLSAASRNLIDLCRPESKQYHGEPFEMIKAGGVDLFPHTNHCEALMLLQRDPLPIAPTTPAVALPPALDVIASDVTPTTSSL